MELRDIPMTIIGKDLNTAYFTFYCPKCHKELKYIFDRYECIDIADIKHCYHCGQRLKENNNG